MTTKLVTNVFCSLRVEGIHHWPECPHDEVAYLRDPHRHMFHITAHAPVNHDDRDVEFIMLKHEIKKYLLQKYATVTRVTFSSKQICEFGSMSCEMIAAELIEAFGLRACTVSEDGENGATVYSVEGEFVNVQ